MRHWLWFVVAGAIARGSPVAGVAYTGSLLRAADRELKSFIIPGTTTIAIDKRGTYTVFCELPRPAREEDHSIIAAVTRDLDLQLVEESSGKEILLTVPAVNSSFAIVGRFGASMLSFTINNPGLYRFTGKIVDSRIESLTLAIGPEFAPDMLQMVLAGFATASAGLAVAGTITGISIWQRSKAAAKVSPRTGRTT